MNLTDAIPATFDAAVDALVADTSDEDRAWVERTSEKEALGGWHHSFGMAIRNAWRLWHPEESPLARHMAGLGFLHADDMSGAILRAYWRRIHGEAYRVEDDVAYYREYWRTRHPEDFAEMESARAAIAGTGSPPSP